MEGTSLLTMIVKGGSMMIPIGLCSFIGIAIFIERMIALHRAKIDTESFMREIKETVRRGGIFEAIHRCAKTPGPVAAIIKAGLERRQKSYSEVKDAIESAGKAEIYILEKNISVLATVASIAPLFGFLGTVTGMLSAFKTIEGLGGNVNASVLAGGIWEALITTVAGLVVGIPALVAYNYLVDKTKHFVFEMEVTSQDLIKVLPEKEKEEKDEL